MYNRNNGNTNKKGKQKEYIGTYVYHINEKDHKFGTYFNKF